MIVSDDTTALGSLSRESYDALPSPRLTMGACEAAVEDAVKAKSVRPLRMWFRHEVNGVDPDVLIECVDAALGSRRTSMDGEAWVLRQDLRRVLAGEVADRRRRVRSERITKEAEPFAQGMVHGLEAVRPGALEHGTSVASLALRVGTEFGVSEEDLAWLRLAALVHEVVPMRAGIAVSSEKRRFSDSERAGVRERLHSASEGLGEVIPFRPIAVLLRGMFTPGLGVAIVGSEILRVSDALVSTMEPRPYRLRLSPADALRELRSSRRFSTDIVRAVECVVGVADGVRLSA
jgi:HD-GYP domain-containing protein (c-di-GMP phosphodiesterase class II)